MNLQPYKDFLVELAAGTGDIIRRHWDDDALATERKADDSPVTAADREAEQYIRAQVADKFPGHGVIGEEFPDADTDAEFVWVVDPIDGTKSFITHVPLFGTMVALLHNGQPVLSMIHQPILWELLIGDNETTTLNGKPVRVRECNSLAEATLLCSDPNYFAPDSLKPEAEKLRRACRLTRTWGDCYGYLLLATGRADIMFDPDMEKWDLLPLIPVVRGAGGVITGWDGSDPTQGRSSLASVSPVLHEQVLRLLQS